MDKVILECKDCEKKSTISEVYGVKCPKCGSEEIFILDILYEVEPDRTPIEMGRGGCGSVWR
jgi:anaerobic ribonucleoside-triphosphate reductase